MRKRALKQNKDKKIECVSFKIIFLTFEIVLKVWGVAWQLLKLFKRNSKKTKKNKIDLFINRLFVSLNVNLNSFEINYVKS